MNKSEKKRQIGRLLEGNDKVSFDEEQAVISINDTKKSLDLNLEDDYADLIFKINDFLFSNKVAPIGNFGEFSKAKLKKAASGREDIVVLSNGYVDLVDLNITIKTNMFHPLALIVENINKTIADVNSVRKTKIPKIKL